ncbi:MAG: hypothetical protein Kow0099_14410 [Candidatus Abyssubacteria bacterium]
MLALIRVAGLILGFLSMILLANRFGAGKMTDVLFIAMVFPVFFLRQIGRAVNCAFIPVYTEILTDRGDTEALRMASTFTRIFVGGAAVVGMLYFVFARYFVYVLAPGFAASSIELIVTLTRVLTPAFVLLALFAIGESILNSKWIFIPSSLASNLPSIGMIAGILLLAPRYGIMGVAIGILVGLALQAVSVFPYLWEQVKAFSAGFGWGERGVRGVFNQFWPVLFSSSINQINQIADKSMATLLGVGRVSALTYSSRLIIFLPEVFLSSFGRTILPTVSEQVALNRFEDTRKMLVSALRWIFFIVLPAVTLLIALRTNVIALFFERGNFAPEDTRLTALALGFYAPSILIVTVNICLRRTIFALQESQFIARVGVVAVGFNVLMNFILMRFLDVGGLALATTLSALLHLGASYWFLAKRVGRIHDTALAAGLAKMFAASAVAALIACAASSYFVRLAPHTSFGMKLAHLVMVSLLGGVAYIVAAWCLRIEELRKMVSMAGLFARRFSGEIAS